MTLRPPEQGPEVSAGDDVLLSAPTSLTDLFVSFTFLALQGFGGVLAVVQREMVENKRWMTREQFVEDWAVAQVMPGPNVVNLMLMLGDRWFGTRSNAARAPVLAQLQAQASPTAGEAIIESSPTPAVPIEASVAVSSV